jgi:ERCC4-type nuclease
MNIIIDEREVGLYERIYSLNIGVLVSKKVLDIGDIIIMNELDELCVIERKTLQDLLSSIKDGRYEEQSHRLQHTTGLLPHNVIYIIEGNLSTISSEKEKQLIYSSITSLNFYKGFSVLRTTNINDTADLIISMTKKIERNLKNGIHPSWNDNVKSGNIPPYANVVKKAKKANITVENISVIMLCQIPGISTVTSTAIFAKFGTLQNLINSLSSNPDCMEGLSYEQSGKTRKINSTSIKNIREYLIGQPVLDTKIIIDTTHA